MRILTVEETAAKLTLAVSTVYLKVKNRDSETPRFPAPVSVAGRRRGFIEEEVDRYLEECAAFRAMASPKPSGKRQAEGRERFWTEYRAGKRLHPRTIGRLKREAQQQSGPGGEVRP